MCNYYSKNNDVGNGIILCDDIKNNKIKEEYQKRSEVSLTKLNNYISFFSDKNLAILVLDINGAEGIAIENGFQLILRYHIPYIYLNFNPDLLREYGTDPELLLQKLINNGYKIYINDFLNKDSYSIKKVMENNSSNLILYLVYQ